MHLILSAERVLNALWRRHRGHHLKRVRPPAHQSSGKTGINIVAPQSLALHVAYHLTNGLRLWDFLLSSASSNFVESVEEEQDTTVGHPFKKAEIVSCPGCKQRLRLPQKVACYMIKCSGCGFSVTPQQPFTKSSSKIESMCAKKFTFSHKNHALLLCSG